MIKCQRGEKSEESVLNVKKKTLQDQNSSREIRRGRTVPHPCSEKIRKCCKWRRNSERVRE